MFDQMNIELANQHKDSIIRDAESYRKIRAAAESDSSKESKTGKSWNLKDLAGRIGHWLGRRDWKPRISQ